MDQLSAMRAFRRVVERQSFSKAAEDLGTSKARLSNQIRSLEEHLGVVLLSRTTRRMSLTEVGAAYLAESTRILDQVDELERAVVASTSRPVGSLRVSAPVSYGVTVLSPLLARFAALYPEVDVDLQMDDAVVDLVSDAFDVAVRVRARLVESSLVVRRVGRVEQRLCAAPGYLDRRGRPSTALDLEAHDRLGYSLSADADTWPLRGPDGPCTVRFKPRFRANNSIALRHAVSAGLGIGSLPSFLIDPLLADGALEAVLPAWSFEPRQVYLVYPSARYVLPKVRAFVDFMVEHVQSD